MHRALKLDLEAAVDGEVRFDSVTRALYSTDASVYQIEPIGVVIPRTQESALRAIQIAAVHGVPITPRGGGTSQAGQSIGAGLVIDTSKYLSRIIEINPDARTARVEPGVVLDDLNLVLRPHGLRFAPDVSSASRATIGGMMANNSSGARSVIYGKTIDHVREARVVLADGNVAHFKPVTGDALARLATGDSIESRAYRTVPGLAAAHAAEIDRRFPKVLRRVGGYNLDQFVDGAKAVDLTKVLIGSEGTLGVFLDATIGLVPLPECKAVLTAEFADVLEALAATPLVLKHGPSAVEVMDDFILSHARQSAALDRQRRRMLERDGSSLLCIEFYAESEDALSSRLSALSKDLAGSQFKCLTREIRGAADQQRVWSFREAALGLSTATKGDGKAISFVEDTAVAPERLRDYIARFMALVKRHDTVAGVYAHASVGCLHVRPVINLKTADGVAKFVSIANEVADLVLEFGGALSGEHGDGLVRGAFNEKMFGSELYGAFRQVKKTFDPQGLFNPGRIVDTPSITSHLRYGAGYATPQPVTFFDFGAGEGFGRAAESCSGVGLCRKKNEGTMCPSYMVTREEAHSTRGRANTLRLAMSGRLGDTPLSDEGVHEVLDLCLECRACKSECPVSVDMARYKSEFLAGYWDRHFVPPGVRAIASAHELAKIASAFAPISNALAASGPGRWIAETVLGIDKRRTQPQWTRQTLRRRLKGSDPASRVLGSDPISAVLFADTFTEYADPEIGVAAIDVLRHAGIGARVLPHGCCGRPLISTGMLGEARTNARLVTESLYDAAARGEAIVFVEPSCLSAVREDNPDLLKGLARERALTVAKQSVLFEEFLERECAAGRAALNLRPGPATVTLHVHCHQRSMGLGQAAAALLARIPSVNVTDLDAGCCGMAGSFGYAKEHYALSQAIGERKLLPVARRLGSGDTLVAAGTSCRHQVAHFAGVRALHPAVLLQSLLGGP
jgi:FAD/FMN-containing dehydrogenase/Fe-S oxidoreductase